MNTQTSNPPSLTVTENPSIGSPWIGIQTVAMPVRKGEPTLEPFVDIYRLTLELQQMMNRMESQLNEIQDEQAVQISALNILIEEFRSLPGVRFWLWLRRFFRKEI
jgi:hypothetical protein